MNEKEKRYIVYFVLVPLVSIAIASILIKFADLVSKEEVETTQETERPFEDSGDITIDNVEYMNVEIERRVSYGTPAPPVINNEPKYKTCASGALVSLDAYCTKVCPDGETVVETLNCIDSPKSGEVSTCNDYNTFSLKNSLEKEFQEIVSSINVKYDKMFLDVNTMYNSEMNYFKVSNIGPSDGSYKRVQSNYDERTASLTSSKESELNKANLDYQTKILGIQVSCK